MVLKDLDRLWRDGPRVGQELTDVADGVKEKIPVIESHMHPAERQIQARMMERNALPAEIC